MPKSLTRILVLAIGLVIAVGAPFAEAQSYDPDQDLPIPTVFEKRVNKLGRGLTNILFGWTEIPVTWDQKIRQGKPLTYLIGTASVIGVTKAFMRTGVGVYEAVTFYGSGSERRYEPILEPEYIF